MASRNFTPREISWIVSLPLRRYRMGSTVKQGYFDEKTGRIFMVDENGELTGETATPKAPAGEHAGTNGEEPTPDETPEATSDGSNEDGGGKKSKKKKQKEKKVKEPKKPKHKAEEEELSPADAEARKKNNRLVNIIAAVIGVLVLILLILLYVWLGGSGTTSAQPTPTPAPTAAITPTPMPTPTPTPPGMMEVTVVQAVGDVLKGQQISSSFVEQVSITMQEYNQLVAMGATPCKWDELATIEGMYANSFIAAGSYLSNYYLTMSDPTPVNPWRDYDGGYQTFTISMSAVDGIEQPFFGAQTVMKVTKSIDIYAEGAEAAPDLSWPEGSEEPNPYASMTMDETAVSDTVVQRVFTITDALVCDLLDANGNSLFNSYVPYVDMPTVNRLGALSAISQDPTKLAAMTPASIVIRLTDAEMAALGSLANANAVISVNGNADASNDLKYSITWGTQNIVQTLFPVEAADMPADLAGADAVVAGSGITVEVTEAPDAAVTEGDPAAVSG